MREKEENLKAYLNDLGDVAVAFSGGVDSTYLLAVARETLGGRTAAVTAVSALIPKRESDAAASFCEKLGVRQIVFDPREIEKEYFRANPPDRCYRCKKDLFGNILRIAAENGFSHVADGSNTDDAGDYRPGMRALTELGILSPLREAGLSKSDIRELSRIRGLPTWDMPSFACLATRIPYGEEITAEKLSMIERGEQILFELGVRQFRVRHHGDLARIEVYPSDFGRIMNEENRQKIVSGFREIGFRYISLDLAGFRSGSMNEALSR